MKIHHILVILALILGVFLFSKAIHSPPYDRSDILFFIYFISPYLIVLLRNIFIFKNANYTSLTLSALILVLITGSLYSPSTINSSSTAPLVFLGAPLIILILETIFCLVFLLFESPTFLHPTSVKPTQKKICRVNRLFSWRHWYSRFYVREQKTRDRKNHFILVK